MAMKTFVLDGETREIDDRNKREIVRAKYAGWVEQTEAPAEKPAATSKSSDTKP